MKVIVASTFIPFVYGGAERLIGGLDRALRLAGHEVELFLFPFASQYREMLDQMLALRLLDLSERGDRLICVRTPSYLLRHPRKVLWFIHHHRAAFDLWGTPFGDMAPDSPESLTYRESFRKADNLALSEALHVFTNSRVVSERLRAFNNVASEVLYPPLPDAGTQPSGIYGDYFLYVSRLTPHKRQDLAIQALEHTRNPVNLVIAGPPDAPEYVAGIQVAIARSRAAERITLIAEWISDAKKASLIGNCLAGVYTPFAEDSYGFTALELQQAAKAVIVTSDSGGTLELIRNRLNGTICSPTPKAIAAAMDEMWENRDTARSRGLAGPPRVAELGISWEKALERLLA